MKTFDYAPGANFDSPIRLIRWAPDGQALTYVVTKKRVSNIWAQPVDGGPPKPVTHFTSGLIFGFDWSRTGDLALSRGNQSGDIVLIRNAHSAKE